MCAQVMMYPCCRIWRKAGVVVRYVYERGQVLGYQCCGVEYREKKLMVCFSQMFCSTRCVLLESSR